jgi:hypothetical protein
MAVIFPVTNTLFLPGEIAVYWLEHFLLLVIPVTLLRVYTVPKFRYEQKLLTFVNHLMIGHVWLLNKTCLSSINYLIQF